MEQNFQTSFIPKKSMAGEPVVAKRSVGLLLIICISVFVATIIVSGGAYFYKGVLTKNLTQMKSDLNKAKNRFEPSAISKLKLLDKRFQASNDILSKHITISPIFKILDSLTLKTIRYTKFSYDFGNNKVIVRINGQAVGYRSIALQADLFSKDKNIIDPVFSNLSLDEKGNVLFDLAFSVDSSFVNYEKVQKVNSSNNISDASITSTGVVN